MTAAASEQVWETQTTPSRPIPESAPLTKTAGETHAAKSISGSTHPTRPGGLPRHTEVRFRLSEPSHSLILDADNPEPWDFTKEKPADLVIINIGTNDQNSANNVSAPVYADALTKLVQGVHGKYPDAQVIVMVSTPLPRVQPDASS